MEFRVIDTQYYGLVLEFAPLSVHSGKTGYIEYGHLRNNRGGSGYGVLVDGNLVFESFTSKSSWEKYVELLPE